MKFLDDVKSWFYTGFDKDVFVEYNQEIHEKNSKLISRLNVILVFLYSALFILSLVHQKNYLPNYTFVFGALIFLVMHLLFELGVKKSIRLTQIYTSMFMLILFSLLLWSFFAYSTSSVFLHVYFMSIYLLFIIPPHFTIFGSLLEFAILYLCNLLFPVNDFTGGDYVNVILTNLIGLYLGRMLLNERLKAIISGRAVQQLNEEKQKSVISGLLGDYDCINYVNYKTNEIISFHTSESFIRNVNGWNDITDFSEKLKLFARAIVIREDREYFLRNTDLKYVLEQLSSEKIFFIDYRIILDGKETYYQTRFVKAEENEESIIVGFHNIDRETRLEFSRVEQKIRADQKQKELEIQKKNTEIIQVLAAEYASVYHINLATDDQEPFRIDENMNRYFGELYRRHVSFSTAYEIYVKEAVAEEDKLEMLEFGSTENLFKELKNKKSITKLYRSTISGKNEYYEAKFVKANDEDSFAETVILGFANRDKEIRKEKEYALTLENAMKRAESASRAKSEFLSRMSHDIRTPINGVIGMTTIAKRHTDDKQKMEDCLEKIDIASGHLLSLVNDVLDMSRIESGQIEINRNSMDMKKFTDSCCSIIGGQLSERNLTFIRTSPPFKHPEVIGDMLHLQQIMINILGNAIKFTPDGGKIFFTVEEKDFKDNIAYYEFKITDTGIGMKPEYLQHIWEAFSQEDGNTRTEYSGTGLGMSITKKLVDMMDGKISVESKVNEGSTFTVEMKFPVLEEKQGELQKSENVKVNLAGKRILVVEDNQLNMEIATELLTDEGMLVDCAENGKIAVDIFSASSENFYDAILMDIMMPEMDGLEATRTIRMLDRKDSFSVPIIAMTANAFAEDIERSKNAGMNAHLSKPLQIGVLLETLTAYIK